MEFVTTLAWIFGVAATLLVVGRLVMSGRRTEMDRLRDHLDGVVTTYPVLWPTVVAIICWAWVATY